ncbi:hypothetical protein OAW23_01380 [Flavobacteriales bacterium]|nr:hypothetical protein [Flavobacteriales bacterium]MDC3336499.1 hypothetical protein [Flavobacteriales bacterium]
MKNHIILTSIFFISLISDCISQTDYGDFEGYTKYQMDYLSEGDLPNYRVRKKGDKAMSLYYFLPFDLSVVNADIISDSNTILDNKHRVTERLLPNYRIYLSDKSNLTFSIYFKRTKIKYSGDVDTSITPSLISSEFEQFVQTGIYGRVGYDRHLAQPSFRLFDLDFYLGSALSFGVAPTRETINTDFGNGDYVYSTTTSNTIGLGFDLYGGLNFQFDNFSAGVEIIAFGFDGNRGVGKSKIKTETSIGGTTTEEEFYSYDQKPGIAYSKLQLSRNLTSMYRGVRLSVAYYFQ